MRYALVRISAEIALVIALTHNAEEQSTTRVSVGSYTVDWNADIATHPTALGVSFVVAPWQGGGLRSARSRDKLLRHSLTPHR